eukprot:5646564-Lingulodinium_polyedra.AAC.1
MQTRASDAFLVRGVYRALMLTRVGGRVACQTPIVTAPAAVGLVVGSAAGLAATKLPRGHRGASVEPPRA